MIDANCQLCSTGASRCVDSGARSATPRPRRSVRQWGAILVLALLAFRGSALQYTETQYVPEGSAKMQRGAKLSQYFSAGPHVAHYSRILQCLPQKLFVIFAIFYK